MEYIFTILLVLCLYLWDRFVRKKPTYVPGENSTPDILTDSDRGHRE